MALTRRGAGAVEPLELELPALQEHQIRVRVLACGVCRTDLHVVDGELPEPAIPIVPGHEIVGRIEAVGSGVEGFAVGGRVGIPWLGWSCGECEFCRSARENLCRRARYTGYQIHGGYAAEAVADARFCFPIPLEYDDIHAAPLLCAGLIGYRAYRMAGAARRLGIYGFGAAAHIIAQVAVHQEREVFAFVSPGDERAIRFAREVGASWAGPSNEPPPIPLDAAIIFAPVGRLVPEALSRTVPGGVVVCAGIHMSDIPAFPYRLLWEERVVRSVANLTRADALEFMDVAAQVRIETHVRPYPLTAANDALDDLRHGRLSGAAVLVPSHRGNTPQGNTGETQGKHRRDTDGFRRGVRSNRSLAALRAAVRGTSVRTQAASGFSGPLVSSRTLLLRRRPQTGVSDLSVFLLCSSVFPCVYRVPDAAGFGSGSSLRFGSGSPHR